MGIERLHKDYEFALCGWHQIRHAIEGERRVKEQTVLYLPKPPGMTGKKEWERYCFYLGFAEFPEILGPARDCFQAVLHHKPSRFDLPPEMEYLRTSATPAGEPLDVLWQQITNEVLTTGRCPLLADPQPNDEFRLVAYEAEHLINWRGDIITGEPVMAVLREPVEVEEDGGDDYCSREENLYRALRLGVFPSDPTDPDSQPRFGYVQTSQLGTEDLGTSWVMRQGAPLTEIPLTVINANKIALKVGPSPIQEMSNCCFRAYRYSADWVRARYIKGDPVAVITGPVDEKEIPTRIGGETLWHFSDPTVKVFYLDISGEGLPILRQAVLDQYDAFLAAGGRLLHISDRTQPESGAALRERQAAQAMSLQSIARICAEGLERALRQIARLSGLDPATVKVTPDTDFAQEKIAALAMLNAAVARKEGAPLSEKSFHETLRRSGWTELSHEEELEQIEEEGGLPVDEPTPAAPAPAPAQP